MTTLKEMSACCTYIRTSYKYSCSYQQKTNGVVFRALKCIVTMRPIPAVAKTVICTKYNERCNKISLKNEMFLNKMHCSVNLVLI